MGLFNYLFFGSGERPHEHDWETVEWQSRETIHRRVLEQVTGKYRDPYTLYVRDYDSRGSYIPQPERRVCLTCGKCEDQIADYEADFRRRILEADERKAKALELWSACRSGQDNVET